VNQIVFAAVRDKPNTVRAEGELARLQRDGGTCFGNLFEIVTNGNQNIPNTALTIRLRITTTFFS
jgi:hypothetical protein